MKILHCNANGIIQHERYNITMPKYILLILVLLSGSTLLLAQNNLCDSVLKDDRIGFSLRLSAEDEREVYTRLKFYQRLIALKTYPYFMFGTDDELDESIFETKNDSVRIKENVVIKSNITIVLVDGLTWELNERPPQEPKGFWLILISKKKRNKQDVADRLDYLKFCKLTKMYGMPNCMFDKFLYHSDVIIEGERITEKDYVIRFNSENRLVFAND